MGRYAKPVGTRVKLTIPPGMAQRLEHSPGIARQMAGVVDDIARLADQTCPVGETGDLKESQDSAVLMTPAGVVGVVAYWQFYAHMVHNGTAHSAPNPWLLNAALSVLVRSTSAQAA